jgi:uncharacterized FAD-dependent dehydrogenase
VAEDFKVLGMSRYAVGQIVPDVSEDRSTFIFRVKQPRTPKYEDSVAFWSVSNYLPNDTA